MGQLWRREWLSLVSVFWSEIEGRGCVSLCSPRWPGTYYVDQAGLPLRDLPTSASPKLGLKISATMPRMI